MTAHAGIALAVAAAALIAATPAADVEPATTATSFVVLVRHPDGTDSVTWQAPEQLAVRTVDGLPMLGRVHAHGGTAVYRYSPRSEVSAFTRTFASRPDAPPLLDALLASRDFVLAEARRGALRLRPAAPDAWRTKVFAPANKCAGFGSGSIELWLRRADLLPLRVVERHGDLVPRDLTFTYRAVNRRVAPSTFVAPKEPVAFRSDSGFVRSSPAAAARHLAYVPLMPASLPPGFALSVSGWAPRSATTGAEGSIPPMRDLFTAVYRRGTEEIAVTQRLSPRTGWPGDPFGAECVRQITETVAVGAARATYATSPTTTPHLYWRSGRLLLTVSGPFPKAQLAAVARSLTPVAG